jgi:hypothetical protein
MPTMGVLIVPPESRVPPVASLMVMLLRPM